ncbi:hypothetical protein ACFE04_008515 [Oxalis oulophora]
MTDKDTVVGGGDTEPSAFRIAEKKYKLYYDISSKKKKEAKAVSLNDVLDFKSVLETFSQNVLELPHGISFCSGFDRPVFCLDNRPGFYFIPQALSLEEQCLWIRESLRSFPQPPNRTNHNAIYGPITDLLTSANQAKIFHHDGKSVSASLLLRKLRWATLGLQFDWSKRNYDVSIAHNEIPDALDKLAKRMAAPAMPTGEEFKPQAAIVNYFGLGDSLGGHLDDMEIDWSKPIVSMSLGCKAIFLLGGKSKEVSPLAMFLRSGDVVLMAGQARECFHGVPRIFTDKGNVEIAPLELLFSQQPEDECFLEYIQTSRININIRQVF